MRKIVSKSEKEKRVRRKQFIVSGVMIFIMFFGTIGYAFQGKDDSDSSKKVNYNGLDFEARGDYWITSVGELNFVFRYNPKEVDGMNFSDVKFLENYLEKPLYISSENVGAISEVGRNLEQVVLRISKACLDENCSGDFPIKSCEDNFIVIREASVPMIVQENNCVFIEGPEDNLTSITDEFLFNILGIRE